MNRKGSVLLPSWTVESESDKSGSDASVSPAAPNKNAYAPKAVAPSSPVNSAGPTVFLHCLSLTRNPVYVNASSAECFWTLSPRTPLHSVQYMTHWPEDAELPYYENLATCAVDWAVPADASVSRAAQEVVAKIQKLTLSGCEDLVGAKFDSQASLAQLNKIDDYAQHIDDTRNADHQRVYDFAAEYKKEEAAIAAEAAREEVAKKAAAAAKVEAEASTGKAVPAAAAKQSTPPPPASPERPRGGFLANLFGFGPKSPAKTPATPLSPPEPEAPSSSSSSSFKSHGHSHPSVSTAQDSPQRHHEADRRSLSEPASSSARHSMAAGQAHVNLPTEGLMNGLLHRRCVKAAPSGNAKDKDRKSKDRRARGDKDKDDDASLVDWTPRYFVLHQNVLTYYEEYVPVAERTRLHPHSQTSRGRSHLPLGEVQIFGDCFPELCDADKGAKQPYVFRLVSVLGGELVRLAAPSEEERGSWILLLKETIAHAKGKLCNYATLKSGSSFFSSSKSKYFILNRDTLTVHASEDEITKTEGSMKIGLATGCEVDEKQPKMRLVDRGPGGARVEWTVIFDDMAVCTRWRIALDKLRNPPAAAAAPVEVVEEEVVRSVSTPRKNKKSVRIVDHHEEAAAAADSAAAAREKKAEDAGRSGAPGVANVAAEAASTAAPAPPAVPPLTAAPAPAVSATPDAGSPDTPAPPLAPRRSNPFASPEFLAGVASAKKKRDSNQGSADPDELVNKYAEERRVKASQKPGSLGLADIAAAAAASARKRAESNSNSSKESASLPAHEPPARSPTLFDQVTLEASRRRERALTGSGKFSPVQALSGHEGGQPLSSSSSSGASSSNPASLAAPAAPAAQAPPARTFPKVDTSNHETVPAPPPPPPPPPRVSLNQPPPPSTPSPRASASARASASSATDGPFAADALSSASSNTTPPPPPTPTPTTPSSLSKGLHSISKLFSMFSNDDESSPKATASAEREGSGGGIAPQSVDPAAQALLDAGVKLCKVVDHVQYYPYTRMYAQSGSTAASAIREKMRSEGLDPALLDFPDKLIPTATIPRPQPAKTPDMFYSGIDKNDKKKISFAPPEVKEGRPSTSKDATPSQPKPKAAVAADASPRTRQSESAESPKPPAPPAPAAPAASAAAAQPIVDDLLGNRFRFAAADDDEEMVIVPSRSAAGGSSSITMIAGGDGGVRTNRPFSGPVDLSAEGSEADGVGSSSCTPVSSPSKAGPSSRRSLFSRGGAQLSKGRAGGGNDGSASAKKDDKGTPADQSAEQRLHDFRQDALSFAPVVTKSVSAFAAAIPALSLQVKDAHAKHWDAGAGGGMCINEKSDRVALQARAELDKFRERTGLQYLASDADPSALAAKAVSILNDREVPLPVHVRMQKETRRVSLMSSGMPPSEEYRHFHPSADSGMTAAPGRMFKSCQTDDAHLMPLATGSSGSSAGTAGGKPKGGDVPNHTAKSAFHLLLGESEAIKETLQRMREEETLIADELAEEEQKALLRVREYEAASMRRVQAAWAERLQAIEDERHVLRLDDVELREEQDKLHEMRNEAARLHGRCMADLLAMGQGLKEHHGRVMAERKLLLSHGVLLNSTLTQLTQLVRHPPQNEPRINPEVLASQSPQVKALGSAGYNAAPAGPGPGEGPGRNSVLSTTSRLSQRTTASAASQSSRHPRAGSPRHYPSSSAYSSSEEHKMETIEIEMNARRLQERAIEERFVGEMRRRGGKGTKVEAAPGSRKEGAVHVVHHVKPFRAGAGGKKIAI